MNPSGHIRLFFRISIVLIFFAALLPPLAYLFLSISHARGNIETETEVYARELTAIATRNPEFWRLERVRIEAVLGKRSTVHSPEIRQVFDSDGVLITESRDEFRAPFVTARHEIMDAGVEVGRLVIYRSVNAYLWKAALIALFTSACGGLFYHYVMKEVFSNLEAAEKKAAGYREKLRGLVGAVTAAEEKERRMLALLLHDDILQVLALTRMKIEEGRELEGTSPDGEGFLSLIDDAIRKLRRLSRHLTSQTLYELGLDAALESFCREIRGRHDLDLSCRCEGDFGDLPDEIRSVTFRAARELIHNVLKHARAESLTVSLMLDSDKEEIRLKVIDDGQGLGKGDRDASLQKGFGIFSVKEQVEDLGGEMSIRSSLGAGTRVAVRIPVILKELAAR